MFMVRVIGEMSMMRGIVPADLQRILLCEPVIAVAKKPLPVPLFGNPQI